MSRPFNAGDVLRFEDRGRVIDEVDVLEVIHDDERSSYLFRCRDTDHGQEPGIVGLYDIFDLDGYEVVV